jgi:hypothetical protein
MGQISDPQSSQFGLRFSSQHIPTIDFTTLLGDDQVSVESSTQRSESNPGVSGSPGLRYAQDWKPTRQSHGDATNRCQQQLMGRLLRSAVHIDGVSTCDMSLKGMLIFNDIYLLSLWVLHGFMMFEYDFWCFYPGHRL